LNGFACGKQNDKKKQPAIIHGPDGKILKCKANSNSFKKVDIHQICC